MIFMNGSEDISEADLRPHSTDDSRITRLERAGTIVRRGSGRPLDVLGQPVRADANILARCWKSAPKNATKGAGEFPGHFMIAAGR